jgi:transposase
VDAKGRPRQIEITPGNYHDNSSAEALLEDIEAGAVIGDKAYDADWIVDLIEGQGMLAVIPSTATRKEQRDIDKELYKERNVVERFFNRIKHYRGLATRYEKTVESYLAMFLLACVKGWLL